MMKKLFAIAALLCCLALLCACGGEQDAEMPLSGATTLYVYNWGEYISDGYEDTLNVNRAFEEYCRDELGLNVKVNYSTYSSNEDLYAKLSSGTVSYDVVVPSDYMIARLASEGLIREINPKENIPNYGNIRDEVKTLYPYYDPEEKFSVPYTYGTVGIIYNSTMIKEEDLGTWDLLWNDKYAGEILQFNNPRDAFGTAQFYLGYSVNSTDPAQWKEALEMLKKQKGVVQGYVMDEVFNKMKGGSAAVVPYYAGDFFTMYADNEDLSFFYPEGSTNVFVDAMCIPSSSQNYELALEYINFMLEEEIAIANAEYICYASPNRLVYENQDYIAYMNEEVHPDAIKILYDDVDMDSMEIYQDLPTETRMLMNELWEQLKIESHIGTSIYIICAVIVTLVCAWGVFLIIRKKIRASYYD